MKKNFSFEGVMVMIGVVFLGFGAILVLDQAIKIVKWQTVSIEEGLKEQVAFDNYSKDLENTLKAKGGDEQDEIQTPQITNF